jgi:hypothetical protein
MPSASFFVRFFCLPKKKNQKKGHLAAIAPQAQGGQRTTVLTIEGLMHYDYSLFLIVWSLQLSV